MSASITNASSCRQLITATSTDCSESSRQDWEELLEANIKAGYSSSNTAHLNAIETSVNNLEEILEQQVLALVAPPG